MSSDPSVDPLPHDPASQTPRYDKAQLTSALELLRRRIVDLREPDGAAEALLQLLDLVKRQTIALHAHAQVLQAASASDTQRSIRLAQDEPADTRDTSDTSVSTHLLFLPGADAYGLAEQDGGPPPVGTILAIGEREFVITKVARSPLPGDPRSCVYGIEQVMAEGRDR